MSVVSLLGVNVLNNPAKFGDPYEFEITFECLESLQKGIYYLLQINIYPALADDFVRRPRVEIDLRRFCYIVNLCLFQSQ